MPSSKQSFLNEHKLPKDYLIFAEKYFDPIAKMIRSKQMPLSKALVVGINGCQGSGKTTLASYLQFLLMQQGLNVLSISIDDFYYSKQKRLALSRQVHPLLATRGVPGTHDIDLATETLSRLKNSEQGVSIPRFDKATDDSVSSECRQTNPQPVDVIIFEGWCCGARHQTNSELIDAINDLERQEDERGVWRRYVNDKLKNEYQPLFAMVDVWLMLKAPDFACVYQWRLEQETKLTHQLDKDKARERSGVMTPEQVHRFIQYYQRITEYLLTTMPDIANVVWSLDENRHIVDLQINDSIV